MCKLGKEVLPETNPARTCSRIFSFQKHEKVTICYLSHSVCLFCFVLFGSLSKLIQMSIGGFENFQNTPVNLAIHK